MNVATARRKGAIVHLKQMVGSPTQVNADEGTKKKLEWVRPRTQRFLQMSEAKGVAAIVNASTRANAIAG